MSSIVPSIVYRYRPLSKSVRERELRTLFDFKIWLSTPEDFDDPWDCFLAPHLKELQPDAINRLLKLRIACFTSRDDNTRMWSHYADSHRGICIGYRTDGQSLDCWDLDKVSYLDQIPSVNSISDYTSPEAFDLYKVLTSSKSLDWKDQCEYRYISDDRYDPLIHVNTDDVASITFGLRCPEEDRDDIMKNMSYGTNIIFREVFNDPRYPLPQVRDCEIQQCSPDDAITPEIP